MRVPLPLQTLFGLLDVLGRWVKDASQVAGALGSAQVGGGVVHRAGVRTVVVVTVRSSVTLDHTVYSCTGVAHEMCCWSLRQTTSAISWQMCACLHLLVLVLQIGGTGMALATCPLVRSPACPPSPRICSAVHQPARWIISRFGRLHATCRKAPTRSYPAA